MMEVEKLKFINKLSDDLYHHPRLRKIISSCIDRNTIMVYCDICNDYATIALYNNYVYTVCNDKLFDTWSDYLTKCYNEPKYCIADEHICHHLSCKIFDFIYYIDYIKYYSKEGIFVNSKPLTWFSSASDKTIHIGPGENSVIFEINIQKWLDAYEKEEEKNNMKENMKMFSKGDLVVVTKGDLKGCVGEVYGDINYVTCTVEIKILNNQYSRIQPVYCTDIENLDVAIFTHPNILHDIGGCTACVSPCKAITIKDVKFNGPATIVFWSDGTKTIVKTQCEQYDREKGLAMAIVKKFLGTNESKSNYYDIFKRYIPEDTKVDTSDHDMSADVEPEPVPYDPKENEERHKNRAKVIAPNSIKNVGHRLIVTEDRGTIDKFVEKWDATYFPADFIRFCHDNKLAFYTFDKATCIRKLYYDVTWQEVTGFLKRGLLPSVKSTKEKDGKQYLAVDMTNITFVRVKEEP